MLLLVGQKNYWLPTDGPTNHPTDGLTDGSTDTLLKSRFVATKKIIKTIKIIKNKLSRNPKNNFQEMIALFSQMS